MADEMNSTCTDKAQDQTEQAVPDADTARMADTMAEDATAEGATEADTACDAQAGAADDADENGKLRGSERRRLKRAEAELAEANKETGAGKAGTRNRAGQIPADAGRVRQFPAPHRKGKRKAFTPTPARTLSGVVAIVDTLERAVADIPRKSRMTRSPRASDDAQKAAADALRKLDVTEVETVKFDPNLHNAVMHVEDDTKGRGRDCRCVPKGYRRGDKVIRFAMVRVAN